MAKSFHFEIVTPEHIVLSEEIDSLVVLAEEGYLGVLAGHAPMLCTVRPGDVTIRKSGSMRHYVASDGFLEILPKKATLLVESAEDAQQIDVARAEKSRDRARARLADSSKETDKDRARAALARAEARLRAARKRS